MRLAPSAKLNFKRNRQSGKVMKGSLRQGVLLVMGALPAAAAVVRATVKLVNTEVLLRLDLVPVVLNYQPDLLQLMVISTVHL